MKEKDYKKFDDLGDDLNHESRMLMNLINSLGKRQTTSYESREPSP